MDITGNAEPDLAQLVRPQNLDTGNEAVWVDCGDSASGITGSPSSWIEDYSRLWTASTGKPVYRICGPDYINYVRDCSGVLHGFINPVNVWCPGSICADKNNGAKAETKKDIGFDAFAEVLEDVS